MIVPRQMIASNLRDSPSRNASSGISNEPGTRYKLTLLSCAPNRFSASRAPSTRRAEINSFQRLATMAKRNASALRRPSCTVGCNRFRLRELNSHYVWQYRRCFETHQVDDSLDQVHRRRVLWILGVVVEAAAGLATVETCQHHALQ